MLACALLIASPSWACKRRDKKKVKQTILRMFEIVEAGRSNDLAEYILYRGEDKTRKWKDNCRYGNPDEKNNVQNIHQRIVSSYLPYNYEFIEYSTQTESEGEWLVWEMKFDMGKGPKKVYFAFLKVGKRYLLGDID